MNRNLNEQSLKLILNLRTSNFLIINKTLLKALEDINQTLYLSLLLDRYHYFLTNDKLTNDMFYLTHEQIEKELFMKEYTIRKIKKDLIEKGIISTKKIGIPSKEFIKINFIKLEKLLTEGQDLSKTEGLDLSNSIGHIINKTKSIKTKLKKESKYHSLGSSTHKEKDQTPKKQIDPNKKTYDHLANKLKEIVTSHRNYNNFNLFQTAESFRLLITKDLKINGTSFQEIKKRVIIALKFYKKHIGEPYIPVIHSGPSFREKFLKLENAIERSKSDFPKKDSKSPRTRRSEAERAAARRDTIYIE